MTEYKFIKRYLDDDEEVLWEYSVISNLLSYSLARIITSSIFLTFLIIIIIFVSIAIEWNLWIVLILLLVPVVIFGRSMFLGLKEYKFRKEKLDLMPSELRNYEEVYALTNKRWIQKTYYNFLIDESQIKEKNMELNGDILLLNLSEINIISVYEEGLDVDILFYFDQDHLEGGNSYFGVGTTSEESEIFLKHLRDLIPIGEEEEEDKYGITYLYRSGIQQNIEKNNY